MHLFPHENNFEFIHLQLSKLLSSKSNLSPNRVSTSRISHPHCVRSCLSRADPQEATLLLSIYASAGRTTYFILSVAISMTHPRLLILGSRNCFENYPGSYGDVATYMAKYVSLICLSYLLVKGTYQRGFLTPSST